MKASDLKNVLEISSIVGKGFAPITEYTYFNNKTVKATNMEAYIEILDQQIPFSGCVLTVQFKQFLDSLSKDVELNFEVNQNTLNINYGKKNRFTLPMESLTDFPDSPSLKYSSADIKGSFTLTQEFIKSLEASSQFISKVDPKFNGVYIKNKHMYSSNREILYMNSIDVDYEVNAFIPYNLVKLLTKFKGKVACLEVYPYGFKVIGDDLILYYSNYEENECPPFESIFKKYETITRIYSTEELKESVNRISLFTEHANIIIDKENIKMYVNSIEEEVPLVFPNDAETASIETKSFIFNINYLKKLLIYDEIILMTTKDSMEVKAILGESETSKMLSATVN